MSFNFPQRSHAPILPRSADAQYYAEWAVRRVGRAFAVALFGPVVAFAIGLALQDLFEVIFTLGCVGSVVAAVLSLCFARAPR